MPDPTRLSLSALRLAPLPGVLVALLACSAPPEPEAAAEDELAWPGEAGVWRLVGGELSRVAASARIREEIAPNGDVVRLPDVLPSPTPAVDAGAWLVLAGEEPVLVPLIASEPRSFGDPASPRELGAWSYLGVAFDEDGTPRSVAAEVDEGRLVKRERDGLAVTWVPGDAVAAGLYGLEGDDRRLWIVEFSSGQPSAVSRQPENGPTGADQR